MRDFIVSRCNERMSRVRGPGTKAEIEVFYAAKSWGVKFNTMSVKFNTFVLSIYFHTIGC